MTPIRGVPMATAQPATARSRAMLALWSVALAAGVWVFSQLGDGALGPPPLRPAGWGVWFELRDPLIATAAVLRLLVLALGWYLLVVTVLGVVVRLLRAPALVHATDRITLPALRRFLRETVGVSAAAAILAVGPTGVSTSTAALAATDLVEVLPGLRASTVDDAAPRRTPSPEAGASSHGAVASSAGSALPLPIELVSRATMDAPSTPASAGDAPGGVTVAGTEEPGVVVASQRHIVVQPGDSLWSIAEAAVSAHHGEATNEDRIAAYWRRLIERNRADLPDPDNPDLIHPGDTIVLPPVSAVPGR